MSLDSLFLFFSNLSLKDFVDLFLVYIIFYYLLKVSEKSGIFQVLFGLGVLSLAYYICAQLELIAVHTLLSSVFSNIFLVLVLVFQGEIRKILTQIGSQNIFKPLQDAETVHMSEEVSRALLNLSKKGIGALIVFEKKIDISAFIESGVEISSKIKSELIEAIFHPTSKIHDGAIIVKNGKITDVGAFLPLSTNPILDRKLGTRHRAGLGIAEVTDAKVIVLSEESQNIGLVEEGRIVFISDPNQINAEVRKFLSPTRKKGSKS